MHPWNEPTPLMNAITDLWIILVFGFMVFGLGIAFVEWIDQKIRERRER